MSVPGDKAESEFQIWSSAQPKSINILLKSLALAKDCEDGDPGCGFDRYESLSMPLLEAVWDRHSFDLSKQEFYERTATIKDLENLWRELSLCRSDAALGGRVSRTWSQKDTIVIDDAAHSSIAQPNNLLLIEELAYADDELGAYFSTSLSERASGQVECPPPRASEKDTVLLQAVGILGGSTPRVERISRPERGKI